MLAGRYRIDGVLGTGGMGAVYRARDLLGEQYGDPDPGMALKVLNVKLADSADASALLYGEFALTRHLRHANVLRVYSFEVDMDYRCAFITMELMRGLTLDKLVAERPLGLPWQELRDIALPLLDALAYVHSRGVLHGDIKPGNVMLSADGIRLFDFGLGQAQEGGLSGLPRLSRARFNAWTPGYAAPELFEGQSLTSSADVYGAACVIYELAQGHPPHRDERVLHAPANLPRHCWPALRNALAFAAADRTLSATRLREAMGSRASFLRRWV